MKKTHSYAKNIFREITGNFGRFFSIFAIVALGTGFFAGLMSTSPDMLDSVLNRLDPADFLTDFNRKLYQRVTEILGTGHGFDLVLLGEGFTSDEVSYITKMLTVGTANENAEKVLDDSIKVIISERKALDDPDVAELDDASWAEAMAALSKDKKKKPIG